MKRVYEALLDRHFAANKQIAFIIGPRQVGKTTTCRAYDKLHEYINWDNEKDRQAILKGQDALIEGIGLSEKSVIIFDEIHKFPEWKNFIICGIIKNGSRCCFKFGCHAEFSKKYLGDV